MKTNEKPSSSAGKKVSEDVTKALIQNTEVLMQNYRTIAWVLENFPVTVSEELNRPFQDLDTLLDSVDVEMSLENKMLESRLRSMEKSRILMDRVNEALSLLRRKPDDGERLYNILFSTYVIPEPLSHEQLLFRLQLSSRQYYRLRRQALRILSIRLWSSPNVEISAWMELLMMMGPTN